MLSNIFMQLMTAIAATIAWVFYLVLLVLAVVLFYKFSDAAEKKNPEKYQAYKTFTNNLPRAIAIIVCAYAAYQGETVVSACDPTVFFGQGPWPLVALPVLAALSMLVLRSPNCWRAFIILFFIYGFIYAAAALPCSSHASALGPPAPTTK